MTPYYEDDRVQLWHGDCRNMLGELELSWAALVTDPPYGGSYRSGARRVDGRARSIENDHDTAVRDAVLAWWCLRGPALVFGTWKVERPRETKTVLVWDKGGALGMGDLSLPWKPDHEEVYVIGGPWSGRRDCGSVLRYPPVQAVGREHPNEKPVDLMQMLLAKIDPTRTVIDPCAGSGAVLVAAKSMGRKAIGIELDESYCALIAERLGGPIRMADDSLFGGAS